MNDIQQNCQQVIQKTDPAANYMFSQVFGSENSGDKIHEEDIISVLKFDHSGRNLALGDHAGRVIVFQNQQNLSNSTLSHSSVPITYQYHSEFQSHNLQFDTLRSHQISETIKDICWLREQGPYLKMITTNANKIKVWKIWQKTEKKLIRSSGKVLNMPKIHSSESGMVSSLQKTFPILHQRQIQSIHSTYNQQYLLSNDEGQIMLWNLEKPAKPYILVDKKLNNASINTQTTCKRPSIQYANPNSFSTIEHITSSEIHPTSDSIFFYGTNKGKLKLCDLRFSSNFQNNGINFLPEPTKEKKNFFTEIISSISSIDIVRNDRYVICRDLMTVKVWDMCKPDLPLNTITIQQALRPRLCDVFENDSIHCKFKTSSSKNGDSILTGNFNNSFHLINPGEAITGVPSLKMQDENGENHSNYKYQLNFNKKTTVKEVKLGEKSINRVDCKRKVLASDFHPSNKAVAVASLNCFFIYSHL